MKVGASRGVGAGHRAVAVYRQAALDLSRQRAHPILAASCCCLDHQAQRPPTIGERLRMGQPTLLEPVECEAGAAPSSQASIPNWVWSRGGPRCRSGCSRCDVPATLPFLSRRPGSTVPCPAQGLVTHVRPVVVPRRAWRRCRWRRCHTRSPTSGYWRWSPFSRNR